MRLAVRYVKRTILVATAVGLLLTVLGAIGVAGVVLVGNAVQEAQSHN